MLSLYKFAIRSFSGATESGSEHDGSVGSVSQSGRMMSDPTQSSDSIMHHSVESVSFDL